jgi:hypothetical protein
MASAGIDFRDLGVLFIMIWNQASQVRLMSVSMVCLKMLLTRV